ncbi:hypothetical protein Amet_2499 [Alkaliphilus metalliredigens QYMF]|uniref:Stage III sporulation protein AH n=1 Tax=Alkaliphilus metalliredigens (strain QYMF) TaxID=293826 RepID=A6TR34_ALKMQ|nr:SpoIIIAH-like family protein [Alkaliphilus metalliredigens]ABR48652.1 hypothetical protein Amet_2499 [Alkaliphilus metalliredigens QYMF]
MKINIHRRKNFVILSLILMLGLIGYVNYSLNKQSLLQTSNELEKYELGMLEESGMLRELLDDEEEVFNEEDPEGIEDELGDIETEESGDVETEEMSFDEPRMNNATIVDSLDNNQVIDIAQETSAEIAQVITSKETMRSSAYFIESKLERDKKRSEMMNSLSEMINNTNTSQAMRGQAEDIKLQVIVSTETEVFIENMIMAKGFNDAIVYLSDESISIVVQSQQLTEKDVAQIVDIVRRETDITMDKIIIMNKD